MQPAATQVVLTLEHLKALHTVGLRLPPIQQSRALHYITVLNFYIIKVTGEKVREKS